MSLLCACLPCRDIEPHQVGKTSCTGVSIACSRRNIEGLALLFVARFYIRTKVESPPGIYSSTAKTAMGRVESYCTRSMSSV